MFSLIMSSLCIKIIMQLYLKMVYTNNIMMRLDSIIVPGTRCIRHQHCVWMPAGYNIYSINTLIGVGINYSQSSAYSYILFR